MFTGFPSLARAGTPLGSPNPPVCTWDGALAMVCGAELPVENTLVFTNCRGMTGLFASGIGSSFLDAILTVGAGTPRFGLSASGEPRAYAARPARLGASHDDGFPQRLRLMIHRNHDA